MYNKPSRLKETLRNNTKIHTTKGKNKQHQIKLTSIVLTCAVCLFSFGAISGDQDSGIVQDAKIETTRTALEQWVETQRTISQEKRDFKLAQELLNERIDMVQSQIESLHNKIADANNSIADADRKRADLITENETLKEASASLTSILTTLEERTRQLLVKLPDPLRELVKPLSQQLPINDETKLNISQRFQNIVGILNEVDKFNREITVTSEVRMLPDGTAAEVTVLYLGISQAYYSGANSTIAGIGSSTDQGWAWTPINEAAPQIDAAIAVYNNEEAASFVQLPITIK